jgi:dimethylargininase
MRVGRTLYVGLSPRTNASGAEALRKFAAPHGYEVVAVELRGCLHLKTGCSALDDATVLANLEWVDARAFDDYEVVGVDASEPWAANVLRVEDSVCVSAAFPRTAEILAARGYDVHAVEVSEFAKAEGGMTCMSLLFRQP